MITLFYEIVATEHCRVGDGDDVGARLLHAEVFGYSSCGSAAQGIFRCRRGVEIAEAS